VVPWQADFRMLPHTEKSSIMFALCSSCDNFYHTCLGHLPIEQVAQNQKNDDTLKANIMEGKKNMTSGKPVPFYPEQVDKESSFEMRVERKSVIMNDSEFIRIFNTKPTKKLTRWLPSMSIVSCDSGETENVYLFQWHQDWSHMRSLIISYSVKTQLRCTYVKPISSNPRQRRPSSGA
jgi:hypothetical protein